MKPKHFSLAILLSATFALFAGAFSLRAQEKTPEKIFAPQEIEYFETNVRPLLFDKCFSCHNDKVQQGGLRLDSREAALKGGTNGIAIVLADPEKSKLIKAVHYDTDLKMPPSGKLKPTEIAALTQWVKMGAPWTPAKSKLLPGKPDPAANHWAFKPFKKQVLPKVSLVGWAKSPIDRFVLAKLEAKHLIPAPPADRRTLIRRAAFDLTGLPPSPEGVSDFLADKSPKAWERVIDRLLASPQYGERWGRHWLDVARYADTKGYVFQEDAVFHNAYTYRDYVIRSFNEDLPYDQFIIQQLAADRLPLGEDKRSLAALGFLNVGRRFLNDPVFINDDRIDVACRGVMGLTVACARCHNHKFDPIPTADYYSLYGVFASSVESTPVAISPKSISEPYEKYQKVFREADAKRSGLISAQVDRLRDIVAKKPDSLSAKVKATLQGFRLGTPPDANQLKSLLPEFESAAKAEIPALEAKLAEMKKTPPQSPDLAMATEDLPKPVEPRIFIRGNSGNQGEQVPRRFLKVLSLTEPKPFTQGSGRLELAQAIASPTNPLTARVMVNRIWGYHFGAGLVRTPGDFGLRGEKPTHPELLDWLSSVFVEEIGAKPDQNGFKEVGVTEPNRSPFACGWSIKKLNKLILLSNAYQMNSAGTDKAFNLDPENRLISHQNRSRLDLEAMRDSLLAVSGKLDRKTGGPAVELTTAPYSARRTVYGFIDRQNLQGLFRTFDFSSPDVSSVQRFRTTIPQQALFMMNSPFVIEQAKAFAKRSELTNVSDPGERIKSVYRILFNRTPTQKESALGMRFLEGAAQLRPEPANANALTPWEEYLQALMMTNEFCFID